MIDAGWSVLVIDKAEFPRDKTCAGWVTPAVMRELAVDLDDYARERVLQPIHRFRIGLMGQKPVENDHGTEPVSYGIRRYELDDYLLRRSGAELALGEKVKSLEDDGDSWIVNGRHRARYLAGAGGHFCPVARRLGEGPGGHERAVTAKEIEFPMNAEQARACPVPEDQPELWFCRDLKGYAWIFRKGDWLNVGLGREDNHRLGDHLDAFVHEMRDQGRLPEDMPEKYKGHAYLLYDHALRPLVADDRAFLVGDAAGLAYTQSGEGIRTAVESSFLAARTLNAGEPLAAYARRMEERFGERARSAPREGSVARLKQLAARPLMRTHWFTRHVVTERWFLHTHVPALTA
jgi:flavin-dependent dehydrogenase